MDEPLGTSPPLELRRPTSAPRTTIAIPHSLQSPQDRGKWQIKWLFSVFGWIDQLVTQFLDSPQAAQVYGTRIPHPAHFSAEVGTRFYDNSRALTEPPPAHRSHGVVTPSPASSSYTSQSSVPPIGIVLPHAHDKSIDREQRERDKERSSIPGKIRSETTKIQFFSLKSDVNNGPFFRKQDQEVCRVMAVLYQPWLRQLVAFYK